VRDPVPGGWLPPFGFLDFIPGWIWLAIKVFVVVTMFLWVRATFPRYRYDQIMRLGWKIFIPITLIWLVVVGLWMQTPLQHLEVTWHRPHHSRTSSPAFCCWSCSRA
jgi:hypothetical protein